MSLMGDRKQGAILNSMKLTSPNLDLAKSLILTAHLLQPTLSRVAGHFQLLIKQTTLTLKQEQGLTDSCKAYSPSTRSWSDSQGFCS